MNVYERLLKYVVIRTPSNEESDTTPSSQCQFDLAYVFKKGKWKIWESAM